MCSRIIYFARSIKARLSARQVLSSAPHGGVTRQVGPAIKTIRIFACHGRLDFGEPPAEVLNENVLKLVVGFERLLTIEPEALVRSAIDLLRDENAGVQCFLDLRILAAQFLSIGFPEIDPAG